VLSYSFEALELDGPTVVTIAEAEGLYAHGRAVSLRLNLVEEDLEIERVLEEELGLGDNEPGVEN
jgi:hypothetical protein